MEEAGVETSVADESWKMTDAFDAYEVAVVGDEIALVGDCAFFVTNAEDEAAVAPGVEDQNQTSWGTTLETGYSA